jgi:trigger factor
VNISQQQHDNLNSTIIIELEKADYTEKVEKEIRKVQKNVSMKGFRPGKTPIDLVRKLYGKSILSDEIQNVASEALNNYISDNKLDVLGYPISSEKVPSSLDIENSETFKFAFDLGLAPTFELNISDKDQVELYDIQVSDKEINEDIEYARKRYGKLEDVEVAEGEDIIYATLTELNEENMPFEGGVAEKPASFVANMVEDEALKQSLIGLKNGDSLTINIFQLFNNNDTVISNSLGIAKEAVADLNMNFSMLVTEIKRRTNAELGEDYYKEVFGPNDYPKTEEEYRAKIKSNLENYYNNEAQLWVDHQIGHLLFEKHNLQLPDDFLKRWLTATKPEHYTTENIDEKYEQEKSALQRRLVVDKIATVYNVEPTEDDIKEEARIYYLGMYRQYGLTMMPDDHFLDETIAKRLAEKEFVQQMADRVTYRLAYDKVKEIISLKKISISVEDYFKHVNSHKHEHAE